MGSHLEIVSFHLRYYLMIVHHDTIHEQLMRAPAHAEVLIVNRGPMREQLGRALQYLASLKEALLLDLLQVTVLSELKLHVVV